MLWNRTIRQCRSRRTLLGVGVALLLVVAGCSSSGKNASGSSSSTTASGSSASSNTASAPGITPNSVTVGLMTEFTGALAAGFTTVATGFNARIAQQNAEGGVNGRQIKVVTGDTQSSTTGALTAAQTLNGKNIFAVGAVSVFTFAAEPYLLQQGIPVAGTALDGPEWSPPNNNMFPTGGSPSSAFPAPATVGTFFKQQGATNVGVIGVNVPSAVAAAKNVQVSAERAGLKSTYLNATIPVTQAGNFGSIVQAMMQQHVDAVFIEMEPTANFAFMEAAQQAGMKAVYLQSITPPVQVFQNAQARATAQNTWATDPWTPTSLNTPGNKAFLAALATYAHQTTPPDLNEIDGWAAASAIVKGLQTAGQNPTRASFETGLRAVNNFTADGLAITPNSFTASFGKSAEGPGPAPDACYWYGQYKGTQYVWQSKPICGGILPNSNAG